MVLAVHMTTAAVGVGPIGGSRPGRAPTWADSPWSGPSTFSASSWSGWWRLPATGRPRDPSPGRAGAVTGADRRDAAVLDAARVLGVRPEAAPAEIDRRFREIVKAERPDLGMMAADAWRAVSEARRVLTAAATSRQRAVAAARWEGAGLPPAPAPGTLIDLTA